MDERDWLGETPAPTKNEGGRPVSTGRGRYRKLQCDACGFLAQATAASIDRLGEPPWPCPCGAGNLILPNYRDRAALLCDQAREEYAAASAELRRELRRELKRAGLDVDWFAGRSDFDAAKLDQGSKTCEYAYCMRYTAGRYCDEHQASRPELTAARRTL